MPEVTVLPQHPAEWVVTREYFTFYKDDEIGLVAFPTNKNTRKKVVRNGSPFRMISRFNEIVCVGFCIVNDGTGLEPLSQFGEEAFGAVQIQYCANGIWTE